MKNTSIKTTIAGLITGGSISIDALLNQGLQHGWKQALIGFAVAVLGYLAKDANVTGLPTTTKDNGTA